MKDENNGQVQQSVSAHSHVWESKSDTERESARESAKLWVKEKDEAQANCPSCGTFGVLRGEPASSRKQEIRGNKVIEVYEKLPTSFECKACGLKISGLSKLTAVGLGERFQKEEIFNFADFYEVNDSH